MVLETSIDKQADLNPEQDESEILVKIENLHVHFFTYAGVVKALDGVSLELKKGETLGLVGETGCGKSVTARSIVQLILPPGKIIDGKIFFKGQNLLDYSNKKIRKIRGRDISIVFQDPVTYLNPVMIVGNQVKETIILHQDLREDAIRFEIDELQKQISEMQQESEDKKSEVKIPSSFDTNIRELENQIELLKNKDTKSQVKVSQKLLKKTAIRKSIEILKTVRLPDVEEIFYRYPHELSGGMRQRCMIAISLSCLPEILIADEATTALDVTIQAQILKLLSDLKEELGTSIIIITHDLGIVAETCQRVVVMYAGTISEVAETEELFESPRHPYTKGLFLAIPKLSETHEKLHIIPGIVPNLIDPPDGCRFHPRCPDRIDICDNEKPRLSIVGKNHYIACHVHGTEDFVYDK